MAWFTKRCILSQTKRSQSLPRTTNSAVQDSWVFPSAHELDCSVALLLFALTCLVTVRNGAMNWLLLSTVVVIWLIAGLTVVAVRGKQLSSRFCLLVFLCSSLGAGTVQYFVSAGLLKTQRLSAARLAGVSSLRLADDAAFMRKWLIAPIGAGNDDQMQKKEFDWAGTFQMKSQDISKTLACLERNTFIQDYYSVWAVDIEFHRDQLERVGQRVVALEDGVPLLEKS